MEQTTLSIEVRDNKGKGASRRIRRAGKLPGVVYGVGGNFNVIVEPRTIEKLLLQEGGRNQILTLSGTGVEGKATLIKDYQIHPVSRKLVHVDLLEIDVTKKIQVTVPLNTVGKSIGVAEGGVLNFIERTVEVRCLPTAIPPHIDVDISALKIGDSVHVDDLKLPEGIEKATHLNPTLVTVVPPTKEEEAAPSLAPTAEPEVITAKKPEEGAAGAAAAGGEAKDKDKDKEKKDEKKK